MWSRGLRRCPEKYINQRTKKTGRRATWSYAALGAGLASDCSGLRGREKPEWKIEKRIETKMIQCFEIAMYQFRESRTEKKRFTEDLYLAPVCASQPSSTFSLTLPIHTFRVIKGKEKRQIIFLYISVVVFLCCIQKFFYLVHCSKNWCRNLTWFNC